MLLAGKTALITGAANRIGAQIARTLHQNGANLIIHYRQSLDAAEALATQLNLERTEVVASDRGDWPATRDNPERQGCRRTDVAGRVRSNAKPTDGS